MSTTEPRFQFAKRFGFEFLPNQSFSRPVTSKPRSHDDGHFNGPFLGGLGTANFSRSINGRFDRWQLQQGHHLHQHIDAAFLSVTWAQDGKRQYRRLAVGTGDNELPQACRHYAALFPLVFECFDHPLLPARLLLEYYSPTIPGDEESSALPVTLFNCTVSEVKTGVSEVSVSFCWPNLNGWQLMPLTSVERQGLHWPNQSHAGQYGELAESGAGVCHLIQTQQRFDNADVSGQTLLSAVSDEAEISYQVTAKANQNETGTSYAKQPYTLAALEQRLLEHGGLANDDTSWKAHWHEPLVSAISARFGKSGGRVTFAVTMDWPVTRFAQGRLWRKAYTRKFGADGKQGLAIARYALARNDAWLTKLFKWQQQTLKELTENWDDRTSGAVLNELSGIAGLGTVWTDRPMLPLADGENHFRRSSHFGLLEGYDSGYFYYNTLDLWVYAFPALSRTWPDLADSVFDDYLDTVARVMPEQRIIYRSGQQASMLIANKLPHDLGSAMEDPWVALNGYVMRDDPNTWKDHNPSFVVSFYLHRKLTGKAVSSSEYITLKRVVDFVLEQDKERLGIPRHDEFGDSTWDNLDMRGISAYAGGFTLACWAVMTHLATQIGDTDSADLYADCLRRGQKTFAQLWQGDSYSTNSEGKYRNATMADGLIGIYYSRLCGLGDLLPVARIREHLATTYCNNAQGYDNGEYGPLLVAEANRKQYEGDGGEALQINEVLVGSAWIFIAMLREYGLGDEARTLAKEMTAHLYQNSGLQFRTPAAWNSQHQFRAPLNMRPLSIAWLWE